MAKLPLILLSYFTKAALSAVGDHPAPRGLLTAVPPRETGLRPGQYRPTETQSPAIQASRDEGTTGHLLPRQNQQIPLMVCPEDLGLPIKMCSQCGGDTNAPGICNDILISGQQRPGCWTDKSQCSGYYCRCIGGGSDNNPQVTSTNVVNGNTGIVVWEVATLTRYAKLRASTTVTLTEAATATDSDELQTAVAVIFAGGLAWLAISASGDAAAIAAIQPPGKPDSGQNDDKACQPEPNCKDCGGADGTELCSSGDKAGCPCKEEQNCPNEPRKCSDSVCGGDDGNAMCAGSGEEHGCRCCPHKIPACMDDSCHGNQYGECTAPQYKGCGCDLVVSATARPDPTPTFGADHSSSVASVASAALSLIWGGDYNNVPGYGDVTVDPGGQQIALASYINPLAGKAEWSRLIDFDKNKVSLLVANVVNGPDTAADTHWDDVIAKATNSGKGKRFLGYVRTGYLGVSEQKFKTRLGSTELADWAAQIEMDVDLWYHLYGTKMGGIFFDEGMNECGPSAGDTTWSDMYRHINRYVKTKYKDAYTVLNPGWHVPQCYEDTMDTLLTFEGSYADYTGNYIPNPWTPKDPRKIWHIIHDTPEANVVNAVSLAKQRGAGLVEVTDGTEPNPYDTLPSVSYMKTQMNAVAGGAPPVGPAQNFPSDGSNATPGTLSVVSSDYSSATLQWGSSPGAIGFNVLSGSNVVASVPSHYTKITIGNLDPGSTTSFSVVAIGGGNVPGSPTNTVSVTTKSLPSDGSVSIKSAKKDGSVTTTVAEVLVPYAFVRLYIWSGVDCDLVDAPAWPINFNPGNFVCTYYMAEGENFYKYTGTDLQWSWKDVTKSTSMTLTQSGYTYTWKYTLDDSVKSTLVAVQTQGYNKATNAFSPDPTDYDCKGSGLCGSTLGFAGWCDHARDYLGDSGSYNNTAGNCWGNTVGAGCGIFVQGGDKCTMTPAEMKTAYTNLRSVGCAKCGSWHRSDGCLLTVNYVSTCNNHG